MTIKIINQKGNKATFVMGGTTAFANSIRRAAMEEVPTMAIEKVEIRDNSSVLYDEIIALRLGLLPLKTDLSSYVLPEECKCKGEGCNRCELKMTLKAEGPCTVYASDIKTKDPKVKPIYPKTPITRLIKGQKIELVATAVLGKGKVHAKWSPGLVWYNYKSKVTIKQDKVKGLVDDIIKMSPSGVFEAKAGKLTVNESKLAEDPLAMEQAEAVSERYDGMTFESDDTEFIFHVESWGQLTPKQIIELAAESLAEKAEEMSKLLK